MNLLDYVDTIPDFPKPGISFKDISPLLASHEATRAAVMQLTEPWRGKVDRVVGIESRGFLLGMCIAQELGVGFTLSRKRGKLPGATLHQDYDLEYGTDAIEMQSDSLEKDIRVLIHDDVIATGGTAAAAEALVQRLGARVVGHSFLIDLAFLNGKSKLSAPVHAAITID